MSAPAKRSRVRAVRPRTKKTLGEKLLSASIEGSNDLLQGTLRSVAEDLDCLAYALDVIRNNAEPVPDSFVTIVIRSRRRIRAVADEMLPTMIASPSKPEPTSPVRAESEAS